MKTIKKSYNDAIIDLLEYQSYVLQNKINQLSDEEVVEEYKRCFDEDIEIDNSL